jgi:hypothetical protein
MAAYAMRSLADCLTLFVNIPWNIQVSTFKNRGANNMTGEEEGYRMAQRAADESLTRLMYVANCMDERYGENCPPEFVKAHTEVFVSYRAAIERLIAFRNALHAFREIRENRVQNGDAKKRRELVKKVLNSMSRRYSK